MSYEVIHYFTDLQDFNHPYKVGDKFPRLGVNVTEDRLKELSSKNNKQGKPLIKKIEEKTEDDFSKYMNPPEDIPFSDVETEEKYTKTEINRMSTAELKELATSKGIDSADEMTGGELKKLLIELLNL